MEIYNNNLKSTNDIFKIKTGTLILNEIKTNIDIKILHYLFCTDQYYTIVAVLSCLN